MLEEFKTKIESALGERSEDLDIEKVETKAVELEEGEENDNDDGWCVHLNIRGYKLSLSSYFLIAFNWVHLSASG